MYYGVLAKKLGILRKMSEVLKRGIEARCKVMEDMREQVRIDNAKEMMKDGLSEEKVAQYSGLSLEKVKKIANEMPVMA